MVEQYKQLKKEYKMLKQGLEENEEELFQLNCRLPKKKVFMPDKFRDTLQAREELTKGNY